MSRGRGRWRKAPEAAVITSAPLSPGHEYTHRRRRYTALMLLRIVCLLGAVGIYTFSIWLALALVIGGAVLPWCAVLIANDGPPRRRRARLAPVTPPATPQLPGASPNRTVDG